MIEGRSPNSKPQHPQGPGTSLINRPREGSSISLIAAIIAIVVVIGGIFLYGRNTGTTSVAQHTPPATTTAPSSGLSPGTSEPKTQAPMKSNPEGTR